MASTLCWFRDKHSRLLRCYLFVDCGLVSKYQFSKISLCIEYMYVHLLHRCVKKKEKSDSDFPFSTFSAHFMVHIFPLIIYSVQFLLLSHVILLQFSFSCLQVFKMNELHIRNLRNLYCLYIKKMTTPKYWKKGI